MSTPKDVFRARFTAYRRALTDAGYAARSAAVCTHLAALPEVAEADVLHGYWPILPSREVDVRPLLHARWAAGRTVVLPRVRTFGREATATPRLDHVRCPSADALALNRWHIAEPTGDDLVPPDALDVVLVPALGLDRQGHRIGHGFGYYDEFLARTDAFTVGIAYDACLVDALPHDAHDIPLDAVVTEAGVLRVERLQPNTPGGVS